MIGWLVDEFGIEPHVNLIDKAERTDGTFSRSDFTFDPESNLYVCSRRQRAKKYDRAFSKPRDGVTKEGRDALRSSEAHTQARSIAPPWPKWSQGRVNIRDLTLPTATRYRCRDRAPFSVQNNRRGDRRCAAVSDQIFWLSRLC
jgi:hypothetical protein